MNRVLDDESLNLISVIKKAFSKVKYPGDNELVNCNCDECMDYKEAFRGKDWRYLGVDFICPNYSHMCFFTDEAFRYYLPCYMISCIQDLYEVDVMADYLVNTLTRPAKGDDDSDMDILLCLADGDENCLRKITELDKELKSTDKEILENVKSFHARCDPLSTDQKLAVRDFLEWLIINGDDGFDDEPRIALDRYWGRI